ncbi:CHAT domain-containing protein [Leptothermofonsia sp. ETS-13]|uniref:CHAT domain-containing protein n=1 Tax=Leptothermofonsia sp. ETS-13 TaxID=3035696 RepID=UPI003BA21CB3
MTLVSLVITVYNREHYLGAAIESVLAQTYSDFELVVWDDGSTDRSLEIAQEYARCDRRVRVIAAPHAGRVPALQAAIANTTGTYLGWVDSDDLLDPKALEETVAILNAHRNVGMVYTDYLDMNESGQMLGYGYRCQIPYSRDRLLLDFMTFHFRLIRRSVFDQVGGIDGSLDYVEDYDLCLRLSEVTRVSHVRKPLYYYRHHGGNASHEWRIEQVLRSRAIIRQALKRRGLSDQWEIHIQFPEGRFVLRRKQVGLRPSPACGTGTEMRKKRAAFLVPLFREGWRQPLSPPKFCVVPLLLALPLATLSPAGTVRAQSITPTPNGTNTIVTPTGDRLDITGGTQAGANLFHSFQRFGLDAGQIANFLSNPSVQNILGRVTGGDASIINGLIQVTGSNANLYLMNPAGIVFGPNARLNVPGSFIATTANGIGFGCAGPGVRCAGWFNAVGTNDYTALVGTPDTFAFTMAQPGAIVNAGNLAVEDERSLILLGGTVLNAGQLSAPGGQVTLAAVPGSNLVRLSQQDSLLNLEFIPTTTPSLSSGASPAPLPFTPLTLPQLLTGGNLTSATGVTVNPDGTIQLGGSSLRVSTNPGTAIVSGSITTSNASLSPIPDSPLPTPLLVNVLGTQVGLIGATINASGLTGGETVRIGGDYQGRGPVPNAQSTFVDASSTINADSLRNGNGGRVILWADQITRFYGNISARGGALSGDGGFVEVSGKQDLVYQGFADVSAPAGNPGTLLLDPTNITIVAGAYGYGTGDTALPDIFSTDFPGASITVSEGALEGFGYGNIILEATNDITVASLADGVLNLFNSSSVTFRADADGDGAGSFIMGAGYGLVANGQNLTISGANLILGNIDTSSPEFGNGGDVNLDAAGNITVGNINTSSFTGLGYRAGNVDIASASGAIATGNIFTNSDVQAGAVTLSAPGSNSDVTFGSISAVGTGAGSAGAPVSITAGRFVRGTGFIDGATTPTIDSSGAGTSGSIRIEHGGGLADVQFVVGDAAINGTAGRLVTGTAAAPSTIEPIRSFPGSFSTTGIDIITTTSPPPPPPIDPGDGGGDGNQGRPDIPLDDQEEISSDLADTSEEDLFLDLPDGDGSFLDEPGDSDVASLEEDANLEFEEYLDIPDDLPTLNAGDAENILDRIRLETGVKPALVYASFIPASVATERGKPTKFPAKMAWANAYSGSKNRADPPSPGQSFVNNPIGQPNTQPGKVAQKQRSQTLRQKLPPSDQDQLELVVVTAEGKPIRKLVAGATRGQVLKMARRFINEVTDPRKVRTTSYLNAAQQLYRWMVAPIESELQARGIGNLAYISDTGLRFIPMVALHDGKQFLVEKYSFGLMPSFSLTDTRYTSLKNATVLAMGASEFADQPPLPAVPTELKVITKDLWRGSSFLNQDFTLANLRAQRTEEPYQIIHLATHGEFQPGALSNSYIQLWDTRLQLDQLRQLGWSNPPVELLVLSTCRTALGSDDAELGFAGFAVQAGAKTALASLWSVSDEGTLALMTEFYRQLQTAPIKAEALRQAQIAMLKGEVQIDGDQLRGSRGGGLVLPATLVVGSKRTLNHPYYWASFTLIGSPW